MSGARRPFRPPQPRAEGSSSIDQAANAALERSPKVQRTDAAGATAAAAAAAGPAATVVETPRSQPDPAAADGDEPSWMKSPEDEGAWLAALSAAEAQAPQPAEAAAAGGDDDDGGGGGGDDAPDADEAWLEELKAADRRSEQQPPSPEPASPARAAATDADADADAGADADADAGADAGADSPTLGAASAAAAVPPSSPQLDIGEFLPGELAEHYAKAGMTTLHPWQSECLQTGTALDGGSLVFTAPTSGGKTLVAEILMLRSHLRLKKKAILVVPYVSIVREKAKWLDYVLGSHGIRVQEFHGITGGDMDKADMAVCTMEKANALVNRLMADGQMNQIGIVVVDEMHMLGDQYRGYLLELLMTKVKYVGRHDEIQFVGMSATLPNIQEVADWMGAALYESNFRPVPLDEFIKCGTRIYQHVGGGETVHRADLPQAHPSDKDHVVALCVETLNEDNGVLVFVASKKGCVSTAQMISKVLPEVNPVFDSDPKQVAMQQRRLELVDTLKRTPGGLCPTLEKTVPHGVAYHNAGLTVEERDAIESAFREGVVRILTATSTLAAGVNLPARRVIFRSPYIGIEFLDATRYRQMCGRAGRAGIDTRGESFIICEQKDSDKINALLVEQMRELKSCLKEAPSPERGGAPPTANDDGRGVGLERAVLEVISAGAVSTGDEVELWLKCTLLAHQNPYPEVHRNCKCALEYLGQQNFLGYDKKTNVFFATGLGVATFQSSLPPRDAFRVAEDLLKARKHFILASDLHLLYQVTPVSGNPPLSPSTWESYPNHLDRLSECDRQVASHIGIEEQVARRIARRPPKFGATETEEILRYKRFFASMMLSWLVQERPVDWVADRYGVQRGALQNLMGAAATFANLVSNFCQQLKWWDLEVLTGSFAKRLNHGCQVDVLPLCEIPGVQGTRARALYKAGLRTVAAVAMETIETIVKAITADQAFQLTSGGRELTARQKKVDLAAARKIQDGAKAIIMAQAAELTKQSIDLLGEMDSTASAAAAATAVAGPVPKARASVAASSDASTSGGVSMQLGVQPTGQTHGDDTHDHEAAATDKAEQSTTGMAGESDNLKFSHVVQNGEYTCVKVKRQEDCVKLLQLLESQGPKRFSWSIVHGSRRAAAFTENGRGKDEAGGMVVKSASVSVHGVCLCWSGRRVYYADCTDNAPLCQRLLDYICRSPCHKIAYCMKATLHVVAAVRGHHRLSGTPMDPQMAAWMIDPDADISKLDMKKLIDKYGLPKVPMTLERWNNAALEAASAYALMQKLDALLEQRNLRQQFIHGMMPTVAVWVHMELFGIGFDTRLSRQHEHQIVEHIAGLERLAYKLAGGKKFDLSSPKQVGQVLYQRLKLPPDPRQKVKEGKLSTTNAEALEYMMEHSPHPILQVISNHRQLSKLLNAFIRPLQLHAELNKTVQSAGLGERIHPNVLMFAVPTGRIAMDDNSNLQCIPNPKELKLTTMPAPPPPVAAVTGDGTTSAAAAAAAAAAAVTGAETVTEDFYVAMRETFVASEGCVLLSADYSQIELRLMAHVSKDEQLIEAFKSGDDVFKQMAARWEDCDAADVSSEARGRAKTLCYGVLYGAGKATLAKNLGMPEAEAERQKIGLLSKYPRVKEFHRLVEAECKHRGYIETLGGRRRDFPAIDSRNGNAAAAAIRTAVNTICQGSAADLINAAMVQIYKRFCDEAEEGDADDAAAAGAGAAGEGAGAGAGAGAVRRPAVRIVNQVHDELMLELPEGMLGVVGPFVQSAMENAMALRVPLKVNLQAGKNWESMKAYTCK